VYIPLTEIDPSLVGNELQPDERVPPLLSAKTVFLRASGEKAPSGMGGFLTKMATKKYNYADAESAGNDVIDALKKNKRWILAEAASNADLVIWIEETNSSSSRHIVDRLWVFKGGSIPDKSTTQPLWFCMQDHEYRTASTLAKWLEEDVRVLTKLPSHQVTVMPHDATQKE
jgi:hypothetical protein